RFEALFTDLLKAGVNNVRDVDFRTSQIRKHKDEARALAIRAAREKAVALTREVGQTIGKAYSIREVPDTSYMPANAYSNVTSVAEGDSPENESTIAPGMITVKARVLVSFRLE
ncbi:MAG TPA: SIMPL domain-containing protein, partial [Pyrinomonadaceae bacterium]|nr:SIMPL domain-containing protein [Pyrinomonadaceae bacterium]